MLSTGIKTQRRVSMKSKGSETVKISRAKVLATFFVIGSVLLGKSALGQGTTDPQGMLQIFSDASVNWQNAIIPYALDLFKLLATVDFAWTGITLLLEKSDLQTFVAAVIRKLMVIGMFYALLVFAPQWFPAIIQSFVQIGGAASGTPTPLNPSDILKMGVTIAGTLLYQSSQTSSLLSGFATSLSLIFAAAVILVSYVMIALHFVMAMVESYVVIGAGYIFLGFGGSRWTTPYAEKYVSQVINVGTRLMVLYLVIGLGQQFATQWIAQAQIAAVGSTGNLSLSWMLAAQVAMYALICWTVPKLVSNVIGGTLSASAGDAVGMGVAAGAAALSAAALVSGVGAPAAAAGGTAAVSSVAGAAGAASATTGAAGAGVAAAGAGGAASTAAGGAAFGGSSVAPALASGAGGFGGGGVVSSSGSGAAFQPPPPSGSGGSPSTSAASPGPVSTKSLGPGPGPAQPTSSVAQVPPPTSALMDSKVQAGLNKTKEFIQGVHSSLPSDGAVSSGPGLSIGHPSE
jgi:type IV secretion system protein TrbL